MEVGWAQTLKLSKNRDHAFGLCISADRVYAVGADEYYGTGNMRYRVLAFRANDGSQISEWADDKTHPFASLLTCTSYGDVIYALGTTNEFWSILVFNKNLELIRRTDINNPRVIPFSAFIQYRYPELNLYVGGTSILDDGSTNLYVARISATNLNVLNSTMLNADATGAGAYSIVYSYATKQITAGGFVKTQTGLEWLLVNFNEDLKPLKIIKPGIQGAITSLAVDQDGYIYAIDNKRLAKIAPDGRVLFTMTLSNPVRVYVTQDKTSPLAPYIVLVTENNVMMFSRTEPSEAIATKLVKETQVIVPNPGAADVAGDSVYVALTRVEADGKHNWFIVRLTPRLRRPRR